MTTTEKQKEGKPSATKKKAAVAIAPASTTGKVQQQKKASVPSNLQHPTVCTLEDKSKASYHHQDDAVALLGPSQIKVDLTELDGYLIDVLDALGIFPLPTRGGVIEKELCSNYFTNVITTPRYYCIERSIDNLDFPYCAIDISHKYHEDYLKWFLYWGQEFYINTSGKSTHCVTRWQMKERKAFFQYLFQRGKWNDYVYDNNGLLSSSSPSSSSMFPKPFLIKAGKVVANMLAKRFDFLSIPPTLCHCNYLIKSSIYDTGTEKHFDRSTFPNDNGLGSMTLCFYQTANTSSSTSMGGGVYLYPDCTWEECVKISKYHCIHEDSYKEIVLKTLEGYFILAGTYHASKNPITSTSGKTSSSSSKKKPDVVHEEETNGHGVMFSLIYFFEWPIESGDDDNNDDGNDDVADVVQRRRRPTTRHGGTQTENKKKLDEMFKKDPNNFKFSANAFITEWMKLEEESNEQMNES